jgi:hypothetical protein
MKKRPIIVLSGVLIGLFLLAGCGSMNASNGTSSAGNPTNVIAPVVVIPTLALGKIVKFAKPKSLMLSSGWSDSEVWGTWSVAKVATLDMKVDPAYSKTLTLVLNCRAFLVKSHNSIQVKVLANGASIATLHYALTDKVSVRTLKVPAAALDKQLGHLQLTFEIGSPASPKAMGVSDDPRNLGIGLVSIELTKAS